ncbi:MAG TPA: sensor protein lytS [Cytophagales bacterium]|jgi:two-component system LytT family sensor kinase|nr:sensor protein lytS [Cytophagales bacterium]
MIFSVKYRYLYILLLSAYSFFNILFTEGYRLFGHAIQWYYLFSTLFILVVLIWESNHLLEINVAKLQRRVANKIHPLLLQFFLSIPFVIAISGLSALTIFKLMPDDNVSLFFNFKLSLGFTFRVNLFLNSINAIAFFINKYKESQLETEQLKKKTLEARFEALRNQINPHFLFNSLNVLSFLVYKDADTSSKFIEQLSKAYRYLLFHQDKRLVLLEEEMNFIHAYLFLIKIRFEENLKVKINIPKSYYQYYIPPATLQLLIENAIKHNIVSQRRPLSIEIKGHNMRLEVINNLQEKELKEPSTSVGLKNISLRYEFMTNEKVEVHKNAHTFSVHIPLIQLADK